MNLTVKDAARLLSVSDKTIYRWIKLELIPAYRVRGQHRFNRAELIEWATSRRRGMSGEAFSEPELSNSPLPNLSEALEAGGIFYRIEGKTREEVLADVVVHLRLPEETDRQMLEQMLLTRERLASTAIGKGVAIPHPRSPGLVNISRSTVTFCFLEHPIDYHALDGKPVSILIPVISPSLRAHLHLLSRLSYVLQDAEFYRVLQAEASREKLHAALVAAEGRIAT